MGLDDKWFSDMPDCDEEDFDKILATTLMQTLKADPIKTAHFIAKLVIGVTRMKKEIKRLRMKPTGNMSNN